MPIYHVPAEIIDHKPVPCCIKLEPIMTVSQNESPVAVGGANWTLWIYDIPKILQPAFEKRLAIPYRPWCSKSHVFCSIKTGNIPQLIHNVIWQRRLLQYLQIQQVVWLVMGGHSIQQYIGTEGVEFGRLIIQSLQRICMDKKEGYNLDEAVVLWQCQEVFPTHSGHRPLMIWVVILVRCQSSNQV